MADEFTPFPEQQGWNYAGILPEASRPIPYANALQPQWAVPGIVREPVNAIASMLQIPGQAARGELGQAPEQLMAPANRFAEGALTAGLAGSSLVGVPENSLGAQAFSKLKFEPVEHDPFAAGGTIRAYHGTDADFENYEPAGTLGPHFGSATQANLFTGEGANAVGGNIRPVDLTIKNPLRLPDFGWENPFGLATKLKNAGVINENQWIEITDEGMHARSEALMNKMRGWIKEKGYDGIVYRNEAEQTGTDSYIALDPKKQIKSAFGKPSSGLRAESPVAHSAEVSEEGGQVNRALQNIHAREASEQGYGRRDPAAISPAQQQIDQMMRQHTVEAVEHDPFAVAKFLKEGGT